MNREDGVLAVVLAAEHLLDLTAVNQARELLYALRELGENIFPLPRPVDENGQVVGLRFQRGHELDVFLDTTPALEDFLRFDLIAPEVWSRRAGFYLGELL